MRSLFISFLVFTGFVFLACEFVSAQQLTQDAQIIKAGADSTSSFGNVYSNGYRMGTITKVSRKGRVLKSTEIDMQVGLATGFIAVKRKINDKDTGSNYIRDPSLFNPELHEQVSPWAFSASSSDQNSIEELAQSGSVVVHYNQRLFKNLALGSMGFLDDSDYLYVNGFRTTKRPFKPTSMKLQASGWYSKGFRTGFIVKVSYRGNLLKHWEIQVQEGTTANDKFHMMTIQDGRLARYAILAMMTNLPVYVRYQQVLCSACRLISDTDYDAYEIGFMDSSLSGVNLDTLVEIPEELLREDGSFEALDKFVLNNMNSFTN